VTEEDNELKWKRREYRRNKRQNIESKENKFF
jgi:hypothetical protein